MTLLTDDQTAIRDMTRAFVQKEVAPFAAEWDRAETMSPEAARKAGGLGLFGVCMPADWGGVGADFISYVLATEELAAGDAGFCNMVSATNSYGFKVRDYGTDDQKERFLRPVASGGHIACMLLTEPHAGSDAASIRTRAVRKGDTWVINGTKTFVTSGGASTFACIIAVTDPNAGKRGITAFLTRTDRPGYRVVRKEHKLGHRSNETCEIALENLEIPDADRLGQLGEGLRVALSGLDSGRIAVAAQAIGVARAAYEAALAYSRERRAFGKAIAEHQAVAFHLAEMATGIEVARSMCHHAARLKQSRVRCIKEASISKLFASQMAETVCSKAIQVHGGYGFINGFPVEKYYRDARVFQIYDGTNEVQKILISREILAGH
jgi:alkylation response protein AidB-like acyl-CoA dehydrogenase